MFEAYDLYLIKLVVAVWMLIGMVIFAPTYASVIYFMRAENLMDVPADVRATVFQYRLARREFGDIYGTRFASTFITLTLLCLYVKDATIWPFKVVELFTSK